MTSKIISLTFILLAFVLPDIKAQKKVYPVNGYYVTLQGDTIHGFLRDKEQMYLIFKDQTGKKKTFTPSKIMSYTLNNQKYRPMFLENIGKKRFVKVLAEGNHNLYLYDVKNYYVVSDPVVTLMAGTTEILYSLYHSGYYITKPGDNYLYSIPSTNKLITSFFERNFGSLPNLGENHCEKLIFCMQKLVEQLNSTTTNQ